MSFKRIEKKKIEHGIIGFIVGDALGVPHEFKARSYFDQYPVQTMMGYGTHYQPKGTWSDDSSLLLITYDELRKGNDIDKISKKFIKWLDEAYMTPHGEVFDVGNTTLRSITRLREGISPNDSGENDYHSNGNGSLMRILPLLIEGKRPVLDEVIKLSSITHSHPISYLSCFIYLLIVWGVQKGPVLPKRDNIKIAFDGFNWYLNENGIEIPEELTDLTLLNYEEINEDDINSGTYVINSLKTTIYCFLNTSSYKEAVLKAVNLGGDTDTNAALTGALAAMYYGAETIPTEWISDLVKNNTINEILNKVS